MNHLRVFVKWDSKFFSFCKFDWFSLRSERVLPARQGHKVNCLHPAVYLICNIANGQMKNKTAMSILYFPFSILNLAKENPLESGFSRYLFTYS